MAFYLIIYIVIQATDDMPNVSDAPDAGRSAGIGEERKRGRTREES